MTGAAHPRLRVFLFLLGALALAAALYVASEAIGTLHQLDQIEAQRDLWQKPSAIIDALALRPGSNVADLGCGSGYFSLKLAQTVGPGGKVYAIDLRRLSLAFLWMRAAIRGDSNIETIRGAADDPRIPARADAVLIANTYHELDHRDAILDHLRTALVPGGRLVIADRGPEAGAGSASEADAHRFDRSRAESELNAAGFEIERRDDHVLDQPGEGPWWLIAARRK